MEDDDYLAVEIAKNIAHHFLKHPQITPKQVVGLGNALYALERLPVVTPGSYSEFGFEYRAGTEDRNEMLYVDFRTAEDSFEISIGGSVYDSAVGSDSFSKPGWLVEIGGYRNTKCELYDLEDTIVEYLNLGAKITVSDESQDEALRAGQIPVVPIARHIW